MPGVTFRLICALIANEDLDSDHIDAIKAFTQAEIDKENYVEMAEGFAIEGYCLLLRKALEGIKQGGHLWFGLNRGAWLKLGAKSWLNEANVYYFKDHGIRVGVFADDLINGFPKEKRGVYLRIKQEYAKIIRIANANTISPCVKFTGVQIERDRERRLLTIHQERYITQMCDEYKDKIKHQDTPFGVSREQRADFDGLVDYTGGDEVDKTEFLQLMGKLVWPSNMTRLDVAMSVSVLCSCVSNPRSKHREWAYIVMGYLNSTKKFGITYGGTLRIPYGLSTRPSGFDESCGLYTAHDSSFGKRPHPLGGYVIMFNNGAIDYSAKNLKIIPDSSCEAETAVGSRAAKATCYVRGFLRFHGRHVSPSTPTLGDNKAMHDLVQQEGSTSRTRYYERATMLIKRAVLMLLLQPFLVVTDYMLADIFTKAVEKATFVRLRNIMMNVNSPLRESLECAVKYFHGEARKLATRLYDRI